MISLSSLKITPEILSLISEIDEFKGAWKLLGKLAPERLHILRKVATIESIGSSTRIEGSKLSDQDVERLLSNIEAYSFVSRDEQKVAGYAHVCEEVFQSYEQITFSENMIKQLHGWLLKFSNKDERHRGEYKILSNNVEAFDETGKSLGIIFETASPFDTPFKMNELVMWTREQLDQKTLHPLLVIGIFIVVFLAIHPFQDGNGRLSRILTTLLLLKTGYHYMPYSSVESIIERNKESYYLALRRTQGSLASSNPDFTTWLIFFLRTLQKQKIHLEQKVSREKIIMIELSTLDHRIIDLITEQGKLSLSDLEKMTNANRNTIKKHLSTLVTKGYILPSGKGRATQYCIS